MNEGAALLITFCLLLGGCETPPKELVPGVDYEVPTRTIEPIDQGFAGDMKLIMQCHLRKKPDTKSPSVSVLGKGKEIYVIDENARWYLNYRGGELVYIAKSCFGL